MKGPTVISTRAPITNVQNHNDKGTYKMRNVKLRRCENGNV